MSKDCNGFSEVELSCLALSSPGLGARFLEACSQGDTDKIKNALTADCRDLISMVKARMLLQVADKDGRSPLFIAAANGYSDLTKFFTELPIKGKLTDAWGSYALNIACHKGYIDVVSVLLAAGHQVIAKDGEDNTPMHAAAQPAKKDGEEIDWNNQAKIIQLLLTYGGGLYTPDGLMNSPYHYIKNVENKALKRVVEQYPDKLKHTLIFFNRLEALDKNKESSAKPDKTGEDSTKEIIFKPEVIGYLHIATFLKKYHFDIEIPDQLIQYANMNTFLFTGVCKSPNSSLPIELWHHCFSFLAGDFPFGIDVVGDDKLDDGGEEDS